MTDRPRLDGALPRDSGASQDVALAALTRRVADLEHRLNMMKIIVGLVLAVKVLLIVLFLYIIFGRALVVRSAGPTRQISRHVMTNQSGVAAMKCLRIYATPDGESHFDDIELPTTKTYVHPDAVPFDVTASYPASRVCITHIPAGMREVAWHRVPEPVLTIRLNGAVEYETSDGEVRLVQAGSFTLLEDTHGKGHLSRHSQEAQTVIWVSLPNGFDPSAA